MTTHGLHQLLIVSIDKYMNNLPKIEANYRTKSASRVSVMFSEPMRRLRHDIGQLALGRHSNYSVALHMLPSSHLLKPIEPSDI
jgi:hypothetical protein